MEPKANVVLETGSPHEGNLWIFEPVDSERSDSHGCPCTSYRDSVNREQYSIGSTVRYMRGWYTQTATRLLSGYRISLRPWILLLSALLIWKTCWNAIDVLSRAGPPPSLPSGDLILYQSIGYRGDDVRSFDDALEVRSLPNTPSISRISRIVLQHGPVIASIMATYRLSNGTDYAAKQHGYVWPYLGIYSETQVKLKGQRSHLISYCLIDGLDASVVMQILRF
ncbi:hypothetical protein BD410DRAFT_794301 [Rickenella mellea]|uniref:Uncharacterized protein n=1 Tax=Rickenella mellea TaxID=50990 RepID=A0A4Y7PQM9_9AGAM|nr:hypothetical protein BD410DRAFT_794301 [Rickenella mellea]